MTTVPALAPAARGAVAVPTAKMIRMVDLALVDGEETPAGTAAGMTTTATLAINLAAREEAWAAEGEAKVVHTGDLALLDREETPAGTAAGTTATATLAINLAAQEEAWAAEGEAGDREAGDREATTAVMIPMEARETRGVRDRDKMIRTAGNNSTEETTLVEAQGLLSHR
jgi:hypothetical protein